jgi:hypothetical protein
VLANEAFAASQRPARDAAAPDNNRYARVAGPTCVGRGNLLFVVAEIRMSLPFPLHPL